MTKLNKILVGINIGNKYVNANMIFRTINGLDSDRVQVKLEYEYD